MTDEAPKRPSNWNGSPAAEQARAYFNTLPIEQRAKLQPLLEHCRQMGLAEALDQVVAVQGRIESRIASIRDLRKPEDTT